MISVLKNFVRMYGIKQYILTLCESNNLEWNEVNTSIEAARLMKENGYNVILAFSEIKKQFSKRQG